MKFLTLDPLKVEYHISSSYPTSMRAIASEQAGEDRWVAYCRPREHNWRFLVASHPELLAPARRMLDLLGVVGSRRVHSEPAHSTLGWPMNEDFPDLARVLRAVYENADL